MPVKMYDNIKDINHFRLRTPLSGGKAGRNKAKTSNVQVLNMNGNIIERRFLYQVGSFTSKQKAINKAINFCTNKTV